MSPSPSDTFLDRWQRWLAAIIGAEAAEAVVGDLVESLEQKRPAANPSAREIAFEIVRALPRFALDRLLRWSVLRMGSQDMDMWSMGQRRAAALLGTLACVPAFLLVGAGALQTLTGSPQLLQALERTLYNREITVFRLLQHPATILIGLAIALALNLVPLLRLRLERRNGSLVGSVAVRIRGSHLAVAMVAAGLLVVIFGYSFTENFRVEPRRAAVQTTTSSPATWLEAAPPSPSAGAVLSLDSPQRV
jgi:hypothetical protein